MLVKVPLPFQALFTIACSFPHKAAHTHKALCSVNRSMFLFLDCLQSTWRETEREAERSVADNREPSVCSNCNNNTVQVLQCTAATWMT